MSVKHILFKLRPLRVVHLVRITFCQKVGATVYLTTLAQLRKYSKREKDVSQTR